MKRFLLIRIAIMLLVCSALSALSAEIHDAAADGNLELVKTLLTAQPDLMRARDLNGKTPLHHAAAKGHLDLVKYLVANKAEVNALATGGVTPMYLAKGFSRKDVVEFLAANGGTAEIVKPAGAPKATPAAAAAPASGLPRPAPAPIVRPGGNSVIQRPVAASLIAAVKTNGLTQVKALLAAQPDQIKSRDNLGLTPMHWAADLGELPVADVLLANGGDVNAKTDKGWTPLHHAVHEQRIEMIQWLLSHGAEVNAKTVTQTTPLMLGASYGYNEEVIKMLLANRADANLKDQFGNTALVLAAGVPGQKGGAEMLLKAGTDVNIKETFTGFSALHYAAARGNLPLVELLASKGADVNASNNEGETPLTLALYENAAPVANFLKSHGAKEPAGRPLSEREKSLVAHYQQIHATLAQGKPAEVRAQTVALRPTKAEVEKVFANNAAAAWSLVEKTARDEDVAWAIVSKSDETKADMVNLLRGDSKPGEYIRIETQPPSAAAQTAKARHWISADVPVISLLVHRRGEIIPAGDFFLVNQRWVQMPPLTSIFPELN